MSERSVQWARRPSSRRIGRAAVQMPPRQWHLSRAGRSTTQRARGHARPTGPRGRADPTRSPALYAAWPPRPIGLSSCSAPALRPRPKRIATSSTDSTNGPTISKPCQMLATAAVSPKHRAGPHPLAAARSAEHVQRGEPQRRRCDKAEGRDNDGAVRLCRQRLVALREDEGVAADRQRRHHDDNGQR